ncbi:DNA-3-methyladenine glycosylase [Roseivirga sp. BDSF3-8]|uniref:DNA-3-methyladenine glycosylase family protein n=1 Tax=Roseivirga sp. BDSF3-8 TaxID=3241598 RepID=UPI003531C9D5
MSKPLITDLNIPLFSFEECIWYIDRGFYDCLHIRTGNAIEKAISTDDGRSTTFTLEGHGNHLSIICEPEYRQEVLDYVSIWLDLNREMGSFESLASEEPKFMALYKAYRGLRLIRIPDLFEALAWSIIGQQINLNFAYQLKSRLVSKYGFQADNGVYIFPDPGTIAELQPAELKKLQFSQRKAEYLIGIANAMATGQLSREKLMKLKSVEAKCNTLISYRGIGPWSANYVLMRAIGCTNVIPHGDAGMINAYKKIFGLSQKPDNQEIITYLSHFPGWQSYVVLYWWRSLSDK